MKSFKKPKNFFKNLFKKLISYFLLTLSSSFLLITAGSVSSMVSFDSTDAVVTKILENNKINGCSYWTVKAADFRNNWLGGDIKPWLYSLSNSWSIFDDNKHNHNFLVTFAEQNQTFIESGEDTIPVSVIASPTPSSLSSFKFKIDDGKTEFDGRESFYLSQSLFEKINTMECSLSVMSNHADITFNGVVTKCRNDIVQNMGITDYIVVPTNKAYDMEHYTGKSTFVSVLFNDYYQNYFCTKRFAFIDKEAKGMHSSYITSYVDRVEDIGLNHEDVTSVIQETYDNNIQIKSLVDISAIFLAIISFVAFIAFACLFILFIRKNTKNYYAVLKHSSISVFASMIVFSIMQSIVYKVAFNKWFIWNITSQITALIVGIVLIGVACVLSVVLKKRLTRKPLIEVDDYLTIEI